VKLHFFSLCSSISFLGTEARLAPGFKLLVIERVLFGQTAEFFIPF